MTIKLGNNKNVVWSLITASKLEKSRFNIEGLQKRRKNTREKDSSSDSSLFNNCNPTIGKVFLNFKALNHIYPYGNFIVIYNMYAEFRESY